MKLLSNNKIKIFAMILMTIDHVGYIFDLDPIYRIIGRLAFPLFAFLIYQGYLHSRNIYKYLRRLLLFGLSIELFLIIINYYISMDYLPRNIFLTLSFGLMGLMALGSDKKTPEKIIIILILSFIAEILNFDYGWYGVLLIISFYFNKLNIMISFLIHLIINFIYFFFFKNNIQYFALLSWIFIILYNGKAGKKLKHKQLFYFYYPLHLTILFLLKIYVFN